MKIAVVGCAHGKLETIYDTIQYLESKNNIKVDLLLCCGDFQATRNLDDLNCMAVPPKFRDICTFYKYYCGEKSAPVLTIFIGGNHEASNYLQELPFGGWVAPNIFYLGYAGVVKFGGIRIAGLSGIYKSMDYCKGRYEKPPYDRDTIRSCYHIRNLDIFRLKQLSQPVQIFLSHDWPSGIYNYGNLNQLLKQKPFFKEDIQNESLGSEPTAELLHQIKPDFWFAAHLHVKFAALVEHRDEDSKKFTKFLALDKCLPKRKFLQIVDVPHGSGEKFELEYDLEWLTVLHLTNSLLSTKKFNCYMPNSNSDERWNFTPTTEELEVVKEKFQSELKIPHNFVATAPSYNPNSLNEPEESVSPKINPQTVQFCEKLGVDDPISLISKDGKFNTSISSLNTASFDSSSFIAPNDSELDTSQPSYATPPWKTGKEMLKTPLRLPEPINSPDISSGSCFTSTPYKEDEETKRKSDLPSTSTEKDESSGCADDSLGSQPTFVVQKHEKLSKCKLNSLIFADAVAAPGPKKFKRRNLAIYASNDDDD